MKTKAIKFELSGDYALFKKPFANNQPQSFIIPPKTAIFGMIGAIMGWGKDEYLSKLSFKALFYSVKLKTAKVQKELVGINLMQGKNAKFDFNHNPINTPPERGQRSPTRYEFLKCMEWEIFLIIEDKKIEEEFYDRLIDKKFVYNPNLGMQQLFAKIENANLMDIKLSSDINNNMYSSFEKDFVAFKILKPAAFYNELIPVYYEKDRSLPQTKEIISLVGEYEIEITNKSELINKLYKDDDGRLYQFF